VKEIHRRFSEWTVRVVENLKLDFDFYWAFDDHADTKMPIHPIQPTAMDIGRMKAQYGSRVCLIGNIDLDYMLTRGTPEEVGQEVRERIAVAGTRGGYIMSSANSLTDYCKVDNVRAMAKALKEYGGY